MRIFPVLACMLIAMLPQKSWSQANAYNAPLPKMGQVLMAQMVSSVPACDPFNHPPPAVTQFLSTDDRALLWFVVSGATAGDRVSAEFYTPAVPAAVYAAATANWQPLAGSGTYCFTANTLRISGTEVASMPGQWTASVKMNGMMAVNVPFQIVAAPCTYSLSPTSQTISPSGGSGSVNVIMNGGGCGPWGAASSVGWITVQSGANGTGNGTVTYNVAANTTGYLRTGTLSIAGKTFTVTQPAPCTYTLNPASASFGNGAGSGTVSVRTDTGCTWTAASNTNWLTIRAVQSGTSISDGKVTYDVAANTSPSARSGTLSIAGQTFTVSQAAGVCSYSLDPASASFGSGGGNGSVNVTVTGTGCPAWAAISNVDWIDVQSGASTSGSGSVSYSVAPNTGASPRTGTLAIGGLSFPVTEAAGPQVLVSLMTRTNPATCDPGNPPPGETSFQTTDALAVLWFAVANVQDGDTAISEFYTPSGQLYAAATANWGKLSTAASTCFWNSRLKIAGNPPAGTPGTWTARVTYNGRPLFSLTFDIGASRPTIQPGGITSASGFGGMATITAGTWIEIMGSKLASNTRSWRGDDFDGANAPTTLDGVTVTINSQKAFLSYISPVQVNALVPSGIGTGTMQIVVTNDYGASDPYTVTASSAQPGLLATPPFLVGGLQYTAAILPDTPYTMFAVPAGLIPGVMSRPARPGEVLTVYGVGFGPVEPNIPAGTIASWANHLTMPLVVTIGSARASVEYAGLSNGFVGLYQLNVKVPDVPDSDAVPVNFTLNGVPGPSTVYIAVRR